MTGKAHEANETTKRTPVANRKFKDTVFRMLFSDKEALLSLYNAVNNSHYTDSGALEIVTLENAIYVAKVRSFTEQMPLDDAVQKAVTECIQENILADFLRKNQAEVIAMSIFEYDKVEEEKKLRKAEFDAGVEQGLKQGVEQGVTLGQKQASTDTALRLLKTGKFDTKEIAELCNLPLEDVTALKYLIPVEPATGSSRNPQTTCFQTDNLRVSCYNPISNSISGSIYIISSFITLPQLSCCLLVLAGCLQPGQGTG